MILCSYFWSLLRKILHLKFKKRHEVNEFIQPLTQSYILMISNEKLRVYYINDRMSNVFSKTVLLVSTILIISKHTLQVSKLIEK